MGGIANPTQRLFELQGIIVESTRSGVFIGHQTPMISSIEALSKGIGNKQITKPENEYQKFHELTFYLHLNYLRLSIYFV